MSNLYLIFSVKFDEAVRQSGKNFATVSRELGVAKATVSMYKTGKALPSVTTLSKMADVLDVSCDFLLGKTQF